MDSNYFKNLLERWGKMFDLDFVEIEPESPYYKEYTDIINKMFATTDITKLCGYANDLANLYNKIESDNNNISKTSESKTGCTNKFTTKINKDSTLCRKSMVPYTISANYKYPVWNYQFVTPGVTKDNVVVSFDKEKSSLSVNVLKDFAGNAYQEDIIVDTYGRDVKNIKWHVLNGVTEITLTLKDRDSFSIEYED